MALAAVVLALSARIWLAGEAMLSVIRSTVLLGDETSFTDGAPLGPYWRTYELNSKLFGTDFGTTTLVGTAFGALGIVAALALWQPTTASRRIAVFGLLLLAALMVFAGIVFKEAQAVLTGGALSCGALVLQVALRDTGHRQARAVSR